MFWKKSTIKILFAILTCNRFFYLKNCLNSLLEFVDTTDSKIMVLDCCTMENGIQDYYQQVSHHVMVKRFEDRIPNELYRSMNFAIKYCMDNKIPYVNFIQDDYQYLYKHDRLINSVFDLFDRRKDIGQIQTNCIWRRKSPGKFSVERIHKINFAVLAEKNLVDTGFTRVSIYKKTGFYPESVISYDQNSEKTLGFGKNRYKKLVNGELWFGNKSKRLGFYRAIALYPNMGMMFDSAYVRKWQRFGYYFPPPEKYYLKPFEESNIRSIARKNRKRKFTYIEEAVTPFGWTPKTQDKHNKEGVVEEIKHQ